MWLFLALVLVPIIEITLFIKVGGLIGLWPTLLIVVLTAMLGSQLIRRQGLGAFLALRSSISDMRDPTGALFDGAMVLLSGALLLTPGFLTDSIGLLLLVPPIRAALLGALKKRISIATFGPAPAEPQPHAGGDVIDGDFRRVEPDEDEINRH